MKTFLDVVRDRIDRHADRVAYRFLGDGEHVTHTLTYRELGEQAAATAVRLGEVGVVGDRVVLTHTPGLEFVVDLLGCLYAGMVPVPVYPPLGHREIVTAGAIAAAVRPVALLTDLAAAAEPIAGHAPDALVLTPQDRDLAVAPAWTPPPVDAESLALLQFTSGSTSTPRGVAVRHRNLVANQRSIHQTYGGDQDGVVVSWLPVYHDMGLIGSVLHSLFLGATCVLMSPLAFLERPVRWLRAITEFRGTISPAPDFAYGLCARKVTDTDLASLDLSSWRVAISGGEPVRAATVRAFTERFAPAGFRREALVPSYGLAEATLLVSADDPTEAPTVERAEDGTEVVGCGRGPDHVLVVGPDAVPLPDGEVGEIWVGGPSVADGYWERPEDSATVFGARVDGSGLPYLRTGDLGFRSRDRLFVCGRVKDVLVIRGRNHYPHDIEATAERAVAAVRPGCVAVFLDGDRLVLVAEARAETDPAAAATTLRTEVLRAHGLRLDDVVLVARGSIPKTSSGKIRRGACRAAYQEQTLARLDATATAGQVGTGAVAAVLASVLDLPESTVDSDAEIAGLGLDSLRAVQLQHALQTEFGVDVPLDHLLYRATVRDLTEAVSAGAPAEEPTVEPVDEDDRPTVGQRALWLLDQLDRDHRRYLIARAVRIAGDLDVAALAAAVVDVAARHGALRTRATIEHGELRLHHGVTQPPRLEVEHVTWERVDDRVAELASTPVDLAAGPPARFTLLVPDAGEPVLVAAVHHLVADLWSMSVVLGEVARAYGARHAGREEPVVPGPTMARYAAQERAILAGPAGAGLRAGWVELLGGGFTQPKLPADRPRPVNPTWAGDVVRICLDDHLAAGVRSLSARLGVTPFVAMLSVFGVLLGRTCNETAPVVGMPTAVRPHDWSAELVGYCVNTIPVPIDLSTPDTFAALVERTGESVRRAVGLRGYPLPLIADALGVPAGGSSPLVSTMFGWTSAPPGSPAGFAALAAEDTRGELRLDGLTLRPVPVPPGGALAELDASVADTGTGFLLTFSYATEVFDRGTVERLAERYLRLLSAVVDRPDRPLRELTVLDPDERARLTGLMVAAGPEPEPGRTLIDHFLDSAGAWPEEPAIVATGEIIGYAALAERVDGVAAALRQDLGAGPRDAAGRLLGLLIGPGPRFVTALLAALRAGYGIVPMLPDTPPARLAYLAEDAGIAGILTDRTGAARAAAIGAEHAVPVFDVETVTAPPVPVRWPDIEPDDPAYVVYTSGTTGEPKGVPISHRNVLPLLLWQRARFDLGPGERLAQSLALSFDFGLQELLVMLLFGGTICFPDAEQRYSARAYAEFVRSNRITSLYLTPTFAAELARAATPMPSVRTVVLGGEMLTFDVLRALRPLMDRDARYVNGYGPTETAINCSMRLLTGSEVDKGAGVVPVGPPTGRSRVYVCDPFGDLVPPGTVGEVVIGGPGVSAGYLNRPELTAALFADDPLADEPGGRRYRSGDLGRLLPGGDLVLIGRRDEQVKIRGFRVEPAEVRAVLLRHEAVADAAVVVLGSGVRRALGAVVAGRDGLTTAALRAHLAGRLPRHLLPSQLSIVETLPRGAHGKLDQAAMCRLLETREPDSARPPLDEVERLVARIWCAKIGVASVSRDDNFFDIGGNSLLVGPVMAGIEQELGRENLPLSLLFQFPVLAELAGHLNGTGAERDLAEPGRARRRRRPPQRIRVTFES